MWKQLGRVVKVDGYLHIMLSILTKFMRDVETLSSSLFKTSLCFLLYLRFCAASVYCMVRLHSLKYACTQFRHSRMAMLTPCFHHSKTNLHGPTYLQKRWCHTLIIACGVSESLGMGLMTRRLCDPAQTLILDN